MDVEIQVTTNHHGWFEFRICENNDIDKDKDQSCFDKYASFSYHFMVHLTALQKRK